MVLKVVDFKVENSMESDAQSNPVLILSSRSVVQFRLILSKAYTWQDLANFTRDLLGSPLRSKEFNSSRRLRQKQEFACSR